MVAFQSQSSAQKEIKIKFENSTNSLCMKKQFPFVSQENLRKFDVETIASTFFAVKASILQ